MAKSQYKNYNITKYTPTVTEEVNCSVTAFEMNVKSFNELLTISGRIDITVTTASILTTFKLSLPDGVLSNLTSSTDIGGVIATQNQNLFISNVDSANDLIYFVGFPNATGESGDAGTINIEVELK